MSKDFLTEIVEHKKGVIKRRRAAIGPLQKQLEAAKLTRYHLFREAIAGPGKIHLIAEIKKASPSQGLIRADFDVRELARIYVKEGADAISVLTEEKFFLGKARYLSEVSENFRVPVLCKDFILDEIQIYEAFRLGASAVLLIVAILKDEEIKHLLKTAGAFDMDCLVEVHNKEELSRALDCGAQIIGINHRNLHTFELDGKVTERLVPAIPAGRVIVAESGIQTHDQVRRLQELGVHAVLIGETFMRAPDVGRKIREVMGT